MGASAKADRAGGPADLSRSASQPEALIPCAVLTRSLSVYEKPQPARLILARALGISADEAGMALAALIEGGYGIAPRNPTNGMLAACLEVLTPPTGHEQVITAISKARVRWQAMLAQGTAMAMSRKRLARIETRSDETRSKAQPEG